MEWPNVLLRKRRGRKFDERRPFVFLHIPKSAGKSLTHALLATLQPQNPAVCLFDKVLLAPFPTFLACLQGEGSYLSPQSSSTF